MSSAICFFAFLSGNTEAIANGLGLDDPRGTAGQTFGTIILGTFTLFLALGCHWFWIYVFDQLTALKQAESAWNDLKREQGTTPLAADSQEAGDLVKKLVETTPKDSRLGRAVGSWNDPSPDSDAETLIEGEADRCHQLLSVLQSVASILVLLGLVGNFFGLAAAVKEMPGLLQDSTVQQAAPGANPTSTTTPTEEGFDQRVSENVTPRATPSSVAQPAIENIAQGLEVVVISSVLGIGGMILMLLFVAFFRKQFNHLVTEEVLLLSAEIGAAVRPSSSKGDSQKTLQALGDMIDKLDPTLTTLNERLAGVEANRADLNALTGQLDGILKQHLEKEDTKFVQFKDSLDSLRNFLEARNETLGQLLTSSLDAGAQLSGMATSMNEVGQSLGAMVKSQEQVLVDLGAYFGAVRSLAEDDQKKGETRHEKLVNRLAEELGGKFQDWLDATDGHHEALVERLREFIAEAAEDDREQLRELGKHQERFRQDLEASLADLGGQQRLALADLQEQWQGSWRETAAKSQDQLTELIETLEGIHEDWEREIEALTDGILKGQDLHHDKLEKLCSQLESGTQSALEAVTRQEERLGLAFQERFAELTRELQEGLRGVVEAVEHKLPAVGAGLEQVAVRIAELQDRTKEDYKALGESFKELLAGQRDASDDNRALVGQAQTLIEQTKQRFLELQDRWLVSLESIAEELFYRWHERNSLDSGSSAQELKRVAEAMGALGVAAKTVESRLEELHRLVRALQQRLTEERRACPACGRANPSEASNCGLCHESMEGAVPVGAFPIRLLSDRLDQLRECLTSGPNTNTRIKTADKELYALASSVSQGNNLLEQVVALLQEERDHRNRGWFRR